MVPALALCLALVYAPRASGADALVKMTGSLTFSPSASSINAGDSVTWTNISSTPHNTTSNTKLWASATSGLGLSFTHQFTSAGSFPYNCTLHVAEGMTGTITVSPAAAAPPVVAITSPTNGSSFFAPASLTLAASASSAASAIAQVQFFEGTNSLGVAKASPYSVGLTGLAAGSFMFFAVATDANGLAATNSVTVTVQLATPPVLGAAGFSAPTSFQFSYSTDVGVQYAVDRAFILPTWQALVTNTAAASSVTFTDTVRTNQGFYRVRRLPSP